MSIPGAALSLRPETLTGVADDREPEERVKEAHEVQQDSAAAALGRAEHVERVFLYTGTAKNTRE